jgi:hypothetical protein
VAITIKYANDFIQALDDPQLFTQIVDGNFDLGEETCKRLQDGSTVLKLLGTGFVFTVTSLVTVPWEAISKARHGRFSLRGFGFLCPLIALGAFALARHYSVRSLHRTNTVGALSDIRIFLDHKENLNSIAGVARTHFDQIKSIARLDPRLKVVSLTALIKLHYLQKHCTNLAEKWETLALAQLVAAKSDQGHYPSYTELFTINADFLRASSAKKQEMMATRAILVTTQDGKSLSFEDVSKELGLQSATS